MQTLAGTLWVELDCDLEVNRTSVAGNPSVQIKRMNCGRAENPGRLAAGEMGE